MKFRKLDTRGFSHEMVLVVVMVVAAITGTGLLVASHADTSCPTSGPASTPASGTCPTSGPVSGTYAASCTISNVPGIVHPQSTIQPVVTVTNTGTGAINPHMVASIVTPNRTTALKEDAVGRVAPGKSKSLTLQKYTQPGNANGPGGWQAKASVSVHSDLSFKTTKAYFDCQQPFYIQ